MIIINNKYEPSIYSGYKRQPTGVFIPIEEWQSLKDTHADLQKKEIENIVELSAWQKQIIDDRLKDYYQNPNSVSDFDKTVDNIEKSL